MNSTPRTINRFRGCFIGGPLDGQELPAFVQAGGVAVCRCEVPGTPGLVEVRYLHRRAGRWLSDARDVLEDVEFLVFDGLTDEEAAQLVDQHRERRGGWGDPVLTLPASGFLYRPEARTVREFGDDGTMSERVTVGGIVSRLSAQGVCIAQHMGDESRPLSREEMDPTRCGWCDEGIAHTLDEHRHRVAMTCEAERAADFERPGIDDLPSAPLALSVVVVLFGPGDPVLAIEQAAIAGEERERERWGRAVEAAQASRLVIA